MFGEKLIIKKYPYLGYSENLIEYFGIIGYSEDFIPELISLQKSRQIKYSNSNNVPQPLTKNNIKYPPTVLSSLTSKNDYGIVDNELIITQLYPENPNLILKEANQLEPEKSNVIYSFCFDSNDGKNKLSILVLDINFMNYIRIQIVMKSIIFQKLYVLFHNIHFLILFI